MGYQFSAAGVALPKGRRPDWDAALHAIDTVELRTLWGTDDDLYPWECWQEGFDVPPDPHGVYFGMDAARKHLEHQLRDVRRALEAGPGPDLLVIETPEHVLYVTGGETVGEEPSELWVPLSEAIECGAMAAAGFTYTERFCPVPIEERSDGLRLRARVKAAAARALLYVVEDVEALAGEAGRPSPAQAPAWWAAQLERDLRVAAVRAAPAAVLALARDAFDLARRCHPEGPSQTIVDVLDALAVREGRPVCDIRDARRYVRRMHSEWRRAVPELFAVEAEALPMLSGMLVGGLVPSALMALGALRPDGLGYLRAPRADGGWSELEPQEPGARLMEEWAEWWMLPAGVEPDWDAAAQVAADHGLDPDDLVRVREAAGPGYHRMVDRIELPDATVWTTAGVDREDWEVVRPAQRLREAGALEAAGLVTRESAKHPI